jgi:putative tryptophan/tyrosine transport system substrate-binding protein
MPKEAFNITLIGGAAVWPLAASAQQPAMPVVGLLTATNQSDDQLRTLQKGLSEGGYVEGRNLAIIYRSADNRLPALAADLVARQVSVILALGSPVPARAAMASWPPTLTASTQKGNPPCPSHLLGNRIITLFPLPPPRYSAS